MGNFSRIKLIIGQKGLETLEKSNILLFGIGGVGGYVAEALVRSGIGRITIVDNDVVCESNLNRQIIATHSTLKRKKAEVMRERLLDINPKCQIILRTCFYLPSLAEEFQWQEYDYVIDAIDTITSKIDLICRCNQLSIPVISCMGTGNKLDPTKLKVADIYDTTICPLAKVMRRELRRRCIRGAKVVYSTEQNMETNSDLIGSFVMVTGTAGFIIAGEVIKDLLKDAETTNLECN